MPTDVLGLLQELIAIPSVNPENLGPRSDPPYGEGRMADYVEGFFAPYGLRVQRQEVQPGRANVLVHVPGTDPTLAPLLLQAHMDTVEAGAMEAAFTPRLEDGRLYGRGACDAKGPLAIQMMAVRELLDEGARLPRGVVLVGGADEEFGMRGSAALAASGQRFCGAVVGEPTSLQVVTATNGQMYLIFRTQGQPAHTSTPHMGVNAIYLMMEVVDVLRRREAAEFPSREHPLCGSPVLTVSMINGGWSEHVVPDACEARLDRRLIPGETGEGALEEIRRWLAEDLHPETLRRTVVETTFKNQPPVDLPADHPLVLALCGAAREVTGEAFILGKKGNTDASNLTRGGIPCVIFGPGGGGIHGDNEYVEVDDLGKGVEVLKRLILGGVPGLG